MALTLGNAAANAEASAVAALLNTGYCRVYSGTRPATPDTALSGNTLLAELRYGATAFGAPTAGVVTANAIAAVTIAATGTASFFRSLQSDGTTAVADGSVGTSGTDMIVPNTSLVSGAQLSVSSHTLTAPKT